MKLPHTLLYTIALLGFTLGIHQGQLALWKDGQAEPLKTYPLFTATLPQQDQQLLAEGIRAESLSDLTARLEDYLS